MEYFANQPCTVRTYEAEFFYDPEQLTPELQTLAEELAQFLPLQKGKGVPHLYFKKANEYEGLALETKQFGSGVRIPVKFYSPEKKKPTI